MNKKKLYEFLKNKNNGILYVILIIGVVIMLCGTIDDGKPNTQASQPQTDTAADDEKRLCEILSDIKGAGEVSVMITYYESEKKDIAYEVRESENSRENSGGHEKTVDKQAVMSNGSPMVVKEVYPNVKGVIVTAQGAGSISVRESISSAVQAVMNVPAHRVCVYEKR